MVSSSIKLNVFLSRFSSIVSPYFPAGSYKSKAIALQLVWCPISKAPKWSVSIDRESLDFVYSSAIAAKEAAKAQIESEQNLNTVVEALQHLEHQGLSLAEILDGVASFAYERLDGHPQQNAVVRRLEE